MAERMSLPRWGELMRALVLSMGLVWGVAACGGDDPEPQPDDNGPKVCAQGCAENQVCNDGTCVCEQGFRDCDGIAANGCEHAGVECPVACTPEADEALCQRAGAVCGEVTLEDNCGEERTVTCGTCGDGEHCDAGQCVNSCVPESDAAFCGRLEASCGDLTADDNCGVERTATCGSCGVDERCEDNQCLCVPEEDAAFCDRLGATCGEVSEDDNCGEPRTVTCGTCEQGDVCNEANVCVCEAESDEAFCATYGKDCGEFTAEDVCGNQRTATCGACAAGELCGMDVENVCGVCEPEDDEAFCDRLGATCGDVTALDNCEVSRTVTCGACAGSEVCTASNLCCEPEDDATFCANQGANCGTLMMADSCGQMRTATCGTCTGDDICRTDFTCGPACTPETDAQLCAAAGATCGSITATDDCGVVRDITCGTCAGTDVCAGNQCIQVDGAWLHEDCGLFDGPCSTGLICVTYDDFGWFGVCKQLCTQDSDCTVEGSCIEGFLLSGDGICGNEVLPGGTCAGNWRNSVDHCTDFGQAPGTYLECVNSTCSYVCNWSTNPNPPVPCPSGQTCNSSTVFDPNYNLDINLCQ